MARKINPFAVCKAAGKRGRWPKKKVERCIRAVKKSVGMGHITMVENSAAMSALSEGMIVCSRSTKGSDGYDACLKGVTAVAKGLERRGFMVGSYSRD
jgi:hypothetical protein